MLKHAPSQLQSGIHYMKFLHHQQQTINTSVYFVSEP